ncbi:MAG: ASKHA domain-containing protein [Clostridia bacterium]|nr:ASKHA domain-containing protein [Clostridia bacterium]
MIERNEKKTLTVRIPPSAVGERLSDVLARMGHPVSSPCGGRGVCGKCRVTVLNGQLVTKDGKIMTPDGDGTVLACQAVCPPDGAEVLVRAMDGTGLSLGTSAAAASGKYGFALDIGTTTIAAVRVSLPDGAVAASASCLNPQQAFGADVISRIGAASRGQLADLQACVLNAVRDLLAKLSPDVPGKDQPPLTVAGNATMLHLFAGVSPAGMGHYPFTPAFTDAKVMTGQELGLPVGQVTLLPSVSAFVGGDITAGMHVCGIGRSASPALLLDIGTNGEMVLDTGDGDLIGTSTAAGPALEGANISCGMGGVAGAVCSVRPDGDDLIFRTIGDAPAQGLCGSGLLDFTARLLENGDVDETGYLDADDDEDYRYINLCGRWETAAGYEAITLPDVKLTQKDIREVQLAKSAIRAGLEALLAEAGMTPESFTASGGTVYLAGGLGYYMDPRSAVTIGMLPDCFPVRLVPAGNTALKGAVAALCDPAALDHMTALSKGCRIIDLEKSEVFNDGFIEYMMFPEMED